MFTEIQRKIGGYGLLADTPDGRDYLYAGVARPVSPSADLRPTMPPVYDQGSQLGSCVGNGVAACMEHAWMVEGKPDFMPSRLYIYYNARGIEGTPSFDSGAQIRDGLAAVANWGACSETEWPYDASQFAVQPTEQCYIDGEQHKAVSYYRVQRDLSQYRSCIAEGFPVVFGMAVYESFESEEVARTGQMPMPTSTEKVIGSHCVVGVGYNDAAGAILVRNSWGTGWGDAGHFSMPYSFFLDNNLTSDFWTIRLAA